MALDLDLWVQLNLVGSVSWSDYMSMTPEESQAAFQAFNDAINKAKQQQQAHKGFEDLVNHYRNAGK